MDVSAFQRKADVRNLIAKLGKSSYIAVSVGFWFEYSLAIPAAYGFNFKNRGITLFDEGDIKINTSTWLQVGRSVASLLSLPIKSEGEDKDKSLESLRNSQIYVSSFLVSQKDMFESVLRVTNTRIEQWKVAQEPAKDRYAGGVEAMKKGDRIGFVKMMYCRVFYPHSTGNFEETKGLKNSLLGLPKEDIDEATQRAIKRSEQASWY